MRIFYRGYVIDQGQSPDPAFTVLGLRPARETVALHDTPRSAMRWIDHQVTRQKVIEAGWFIPSSVPA